jgi:phosphohistidine phosphatase
LTEKGKINADDLGKRLARHRLGSCQIISSPLVRAVQTAQIVAVRCGRKCRLETSGLLLSDADEWELIKHLHDHSDLKNVMLVGHEPHLGLLVAALLKSGEAIQLKKGSCVVLEIEPGQPDKSARFHSYIVAGKKPVKSKKKAFITA